MKSDALYNYWVALGLASGTAIVIAFLTTIIYAHTGEAAGALGSVVGGVVGGGVGAGGAALAVLLTLSRERAEERRREDERQIRQINAVISGIPFNIEMLLHVVVPNMLPHYKQSHSAYRGLQNAKGDSDRMNAFFSSVLLMTCPEIYFIEFDFWRELLFIVERDANLLKQSGWLTALARQIQNRTLQRNRNIEASVRLTDQQGGKLNYYVLESILQKHVSIANAECITAWSLFSVLLEMARNLEQINDKEKGKKLIHPPGLDAAMRELKQIVDEIGPQYTPADFP
jgi:hypothetical protein